MGRGGPGGVRRSWYHGDVRLIAEIGGEPRILAESATSSIGRGRLTACTFSTPGCSWNEAAIESREIRGSSGNGSLGSLFGLAYLYQQQVASSNETSKQWPRCRQPSIQTRARRVAAASQRNDPAETLNSSLFESLAVAVAAPSECNKVDTLTVTSTEFPWSFAAWWDPAVFRDDIFGSISTPTSEVATTCYH